MKATPSFTTAALVEQARDPTLSLGDQQAAFTQLVQRSQHAVFALALSYLRDGDDAQDATQDAFVMAWRCLSKLRDPGAFEPWLKSIVVRKCARKCRSRGTPPLVTNLPGYAELDHERVDYQRLVADALDELPAGERNVTVLFYFLGYTQPQIGELLGLKSGTVGKRLHSARLRIRRSLPHSIRSDFVRDKPSTEFATRVRRGLLDEYTGDYRFESRPDHVVKIMRAGDSLVSDSGGQQHVLVSIDDQSLVTTHYDGEGRFRRNRRGQITHFVYYEFGRRLGIARKIGVC